MEWGELSAVATDQSAMRQRPHAVAATAATAAKVTSSVLQRGMRQEASGVCATSEQPSRVPRRDLANRRRYPNYMSTGQQSVEWGERERKNEATRRLISQFMARSACHGRRRGGWGRLWRGSMNGLVSGREEFGASLAQHMTIKCCTAAAVAVAAANCGKKCRRRPKAAQ